MEVVVMRMVRMMVVVVVVVLVMALELVLLALVRATGRQSQYAANGRLGTSSSATVGLRVRGRVRAGDVRVVSLRDSQRGQPVTRRGTRVQTRRGGSSWVRGGRRHCCSCCTAGAAWARAGCCWPQLLLIKREAATPRAAARARRVRDGDRKRAQLVHEPCTR